MEDVRNMRASDACLDHFEASGQRFSVEAVSDRVRFGHEDMVDAAGLSTHVSDQVRMESKWQAHVKNGKNIHFVCAGEWGG